ncbi:Tetratricopeptide repeat-containing protein [Poseidonocella pacifica]|uniref:Tetratricopeptide repeat-containing protein n=1 Tax=Poseidonocella pacifica TaxID=871651 RepID=A0A1I0X5A0_9RHOB|nr:tetratricopeptide repeat protein [Poseidonocella pacifica]SFA96219.1 Tetratricopeptide repeat-containing protein [Poseidonocella pacifica]
MTKVTRKLKPLFIAFAVCAATSHAGFAQQAGNLQDRADVESGEVLDALFDDLANAEPQEAPIIERRIMRIWSLSGSAAVDLLVERGRDALEEGDLAAAVEHLTAAIDHAPKYPLSYSLRAQAYYASGLMGPALQDLGTALAREPRDFVAIMLLGGIQLELNRLPEAHETFDRLGTIHPHFKDLTTIRERIGRVPGEFEL